MVPGDVSKGPWGIPAKKNFKLRGDQISAQNECLFVYITFAAYLRLYSPLGHITIAGERVSNDWTMVILVLRLWCLYFWRHSKLCHTVKLRPRQNTIGLKYRSVRTLRLSLDGDMFSLCLNEQNYQPLFIKLSLPIQNNVFMEDLQQNKF